MDLQELLSSYNVDYIDLNLFMLNAIIAAALSWLVAWFYTKFGRSVNNRYRFSYNFIVLALATMLIITIVKSSIALSLGLVGALSIVRFRAAIKDPEELIYLFVVIAIGLGIGANQVKITALAVLFILLLSYINYRLNGKKGNKSAPQMQLSIATSPVDVHKINAILNSYFDIIDLRRISEGNNKLFLSYSIASKNFDDIDQAKNEILLLSDDMSVSFIDNSTVIG